MKHTSAERIVQAAGATVTRADGRTLVRGHGDLWLEVEATAHQYILTEVNLADGHVTLPEQSDQWVF